MLFLSFIFSLMLRKLLLLVYYTVGTKFPTQPVPGWRLGYALRRRLVCALVESCGKNIVVKQSAYLGSFVNFKIGDYSQIGHKARIGPNVTLGNNVVMGPEVILMTTAHAFENPLVPIRLQGALPVRPIVIGDDVWLGTRVIVLPGVTIGSGAVVGAGCIVTKDVPSMAIVAGNPARVIRQRGERFQNKS